jgi:hypothetical protein
MSTPSYWNASSTSGSAYYSNPHGQPEPIRRYTTEEVNHMTHTTPLPLPTRLAIDGAGIPLHLLPADVQDRIKSTTFDLSKFTPKGSN